MSKRLQVLLNPKEYKQFALIAKQCGMSLGEWVRQSLRKAARGVSPTEATERIRRLRVIASRTNTPASDIDDMLADIERGRGLKEP